ncbi:GntR family transcriptional regulator [Arthrobacter castelli]|uniref:GntR family transcriptional regulator n=1 Tax=Arthrobacter castelli TaxID=271431 RepID=UPI000687C9B4|nr:GntR family transcriptional regulator [Arthrobacter castelli]
MARAKHTEIREWVESEIHSGRFSVGDRLPTEMELMQRFGVSRNPVQKAMSGLVEAGIIVRRRGYGSLVASAGLRGNPLRLLNPTLTGPEIEGGHRVVRHHVASTENFPLSKGVLPSGVPVVELTRMKLDGASAPVILERCVVDLSKVPNLLNEHLGELTTVAYYNSLHINVRRVTSVLDAVHLDAADATELGISTQTPVVRQVRTVYIGEAKPIEVAEFIFHPSNMTLEVSQIDSP